MLIKRGWFSFLCFLFPKLIAAFDAQFLNIWVHGVKIVKSSTNL